MRRLASILFWSVIAAAFIGPGTVTTAAAAGAGHGSALLWTLLFSTVACLALQEAAARLTIVSGHGLGESLRARYGGGGLAAVLVLVLVLGAIVVGCAAYEAGNILGGVAGLTLGNDLPERWVTLGIGLAAGALLWFGRTRTVATLLGLFVAAMGFLFLITAVRLAPPLPALLRGALVPRIPDGAGLLVIGLVGTTVVPYNLFLGSGLARGARLDEMRFGLAVSVLFGGVISMGILVVGSAVEGPFSFPALAELLGRRLGPESGRWFGLGLFAAGFSSAVTAPLAAALTARSLFADEAFESSWAERSWRFRAVWGGVLLVGLLFGWMQVRPIPAIVAAQALNGLLLPGVALFLLFAVNDRRLMGEAVNGVAANAVLAIVVASATLLGIANLARALARVVGSPAPGGGLLLALAGSAVLLGATPAWRWIRTLRIGRIPGE